MLADGRGKRLGRSGTEAFGKTVGKALVRGVIDDVLGLDHFARHVFGAAKSVSQAKLDALGASPNKAAKHVAGFFQTRAPAGFNGVDELR